MPFMVLHDSKAEKKADPLYYCFKIVVINRYQQEAQL